MTYLSLLIYDCVPVNINVTGNPEANIILDKIRFLKGKLFQFPLDTNENIGLL